MPSRAHHQPVGAWGYILSMRGRVSTPCKIANMLQRRAIGVVRVSQPHGREGESFSSPKDQLAAIERLCDDQGWELAACHEEMKVSGDALLEDRPGLSQAVTGILSGNAQIIVADTTERLWWNHEVRAQVLRLVETAGGEVWSADQGNLTSGNAAEEFSGTVRTAADRFSRQQNAEKSRRAVQRAVARGVVPWSGTGPGYLRGNDGRLVPDPATAPIVVEAFERRDSGETVKQVRAYLASQGIRRSYHGTSTLLKSRIVLGEIHFGTLVNVGAHPAIVNRDLWRRVQKRRDARGRKPVSDRLLARQGVLRCGTCDARLVVGTQTQQGRKYGMYRCPPTGDCPRRVAIGADIAERAVVDAVKVELANAEGRASAEENAREAEHAAALAQDNLDAAIRAFAGLDDEAAAGERIAELAALRDKAVGVVDRLGSTTHALVINAASDWDLLTLEAQRGLIKATIDRATIAPGGRGAGRITIEPRGE